MTSHLFPFILLVACAEKHEHGHEHTGDSHHHETSDDTGIGPTNYTREAITDGETWTIRYTPSPDPIPMSDNFTIEVTIEKDGTADPDAQLSFDADMPSHGHGMNTEASVSENQDGTFTVEGLSFHMPGHWRLLAQVWGTELPEESAWFDVQCCD